jgi:hypothetical protein
LRIGYGGCSEAVSRVPLYAKHPPLSRCTRGLPPELPSRGANPVNDASNSRRAAENQSLYRAINERIRDLNELFDEIASIPCEWVCECADTECIRRISATLQEYESVRSNPRTFIVYPEHVYPEVEAMVADNERFTIVEKIGDAGVAAEGLDPRQ